MLVGASLSLSGRFQRQGEAARDGLGLWVDRARAAGGAAPRLIALDDRSRSRLAQEHVARLLAEERVDVLAGPYSSGLVLAVAPIAAVAGAPLWNHGGASDAIVQTGGRHVVSVLSPASDYLRDLPGWLRRRASRATRIAILRARVGTFAEQVARGAAEGARTAGFGDIRVTQFESPLPDASPILREAAAAEPDLVVGVGAFPDDVAIARQRALLPGGTVLALVGAGLAAFGEEVGRLAEGIVGPSQWEPTPAPTPQLGPDSAWFVTAFEQAFRRAPEYPAAQAFALGLIVEECRRRSGGSLAGSALLEAAHALDTTTLYGGFRLDSATGRQIGHRVRLVQWRNGRKHVLDEPGA
ncbi:MAG TPA: ABC transporter substrate-binding protein [Methylomirabilota bacterium]|nr:ABC transporter substrate-binding protein [Methylomirabilota bacterium]